MSETKNDPTRILLVMLLCGALSGCGHATIVRSAPPGARVYYRDQLIGITPTRFVVARSDSNRAFHLRIEREGYRVEDVTIVKEVAPGRVVGGIFTLGISWIFKPPVALPDPVNVVLYPAAATASPTPPATTASPTPAPTGAAIPSTPKDPRVEGRLRQLQDLFERGLITEQEYRHYRAAIIGDL